MQDFFIQQYLYDIFNNNNFVWYFRFFVFIIILFFHIINYQYLKKIETKYFFLFLFFSFTLTIKLINVENSLLRYYFGHLFYIYIIFFLFQSKEFLNEKVLKFIALILVLLGFLSSYCYVELNLNDKIYDTHRINYINFPSYSVLGLLLLLNNRLILFYFFLSSFLIIYYIESVRAAFVALAIFYLIIREKDFKIFSLFSYSSWIILILMGTIVTSFIEFDKGITESLSTGRGHIWFAHLMELKNFKINEIMFGGIIDFEKMQNNLTNYEQINIQTDNFFQIHSVVLKTLVDYGIIGFLIIVIIFRNKKKNLFTKIGIYSNAMFFFCLAMSSLNSSTNLIKFNIYGLLMIIALAVSNKKSTK